MEVRVEKKGQEKQKPKVSNQKMLSVILCWLIEGQEWDEKRHPTL
jgi:hypothetical protein